MADIPQDFGLDAQRYGALLLRVRGMTVRMMPYTEEFDLLANGWRIEVKAAHMAPERFQWTINFHRHGKLNEKNVDAYLILLNMQRLGKKKPLALVIPAPVRKYTHKYTLDSLLTSDHWQIENWDAIGADMQTNLHKKPPTSAGRRDVVKKYISRSK